MGQGPRNRRMKRLPFLKSYEDRHGKVRHYFRRPGVVSVTLPGEYGSPEFMAAYWAARENAPLRQIGAEKTIPGSIGALIALYYGSSAFRSLKATTKPTYRNVLEKVRAAHGDKLVKGIRQRHVAQILDDLPANRETWRKVLRIILVLAVARGWIDVHPMTGMRFSRKPQKGFRAWEATEIAAYLDKWPTGSRERLALALLLYTGQRRSDVVTMGRQHVRDGKVHVVQQKTGTRLALPIHASLRVELDAAPKDQLTLLQTAYGKPFSGPGFTNWFREATKAAGLPDGCTPHGLRKSATVALAEAGCTDREIMAITGHRNAAEVSLYSAAADQARLAVAAMAKVEARTKTSNDPDPGRQKTRKVQ
jgi:integrase